LYKNDHNQHYFQTDEQLKDIIPTSNTFYVVKETENSSLRFVRSSMSYLPKNNEILNKTGLLFGLNLHPFATQIQGETEIPNLEGIYIDLYGS
jgi:hypothetical protein